MAYEKAHDAIVDARTFVAYAKDSRKGGNLEKAAVEAQIAAASALAGIAQILYEMAPRRDRDPD
jgi:hypothetical protein